MTVKLKTAHLTRPAYMLVAVLGFVVVATIVAFTFISFNQSVIEQTDLVDAKLRAKQAAEDGLTIAIERIRNNYFSDFTDYDATNNIWDERYATDVIDLTDFIGNNDVVAVEVLHYDDNDQFNYATDVYKLTALGAAMDPQGNRQAFHPVQVIARIPRADGDWNFSNVISEPTFDIDSVDHDLNRATLAVISSDSTGGGWWSAYVPNESYVDGSVYSFPVPRIYGHVSGYGFYDKPDMLDLGTLEDVSSGTSGAYAIDDYGQVVGGADNNDGEYHAFRGLQGLFDLGVIGIDVNSQANGVKSSESHIVGWSENGSGDRRAFLWLPGAGTYGLPGGMNDLGALIFPAKVVREANDINSSGRIVGYFVNGSSNYEACLLVPDSGTVTLTNLGNLGGPGSWASAINDSGNIVGWSDDGSGKQHAFFWRSGFAMTDLHDVAATGNSQAYAISNDNWVVGWSDQNGDRRAWRWKVDQATGTILSSEVLDATLAKIGAGTGWASLDEARDINNAGQIVGWGKTDSSAIHAFLLKPENDTDTTEEYTIIDLGTLGGDHSWAYSVNNYGQVVGESQTSAGMKHAFMWSKNELVIPPASVGGGMKYQDGLEDLLIRPTLKLYDYGWDWDGGNPNPPLEYKIDGVTFTAEEIVDLTDCAISGSVVECRASTGDLSLGAGSSKTNPAHVLVCNDRDTLILESTTGNRIRCVGTIVAETINLIHTTTAQPLDDPNFHFAPAIPGFPALACDLLNVSGVAIDQGTTVVVAGPSLLGYGVLDNYGTIVFKGFIVSNGVGLGFSPSSSAYVTSLLDIYNPLTGTQGPIHVLAEGSPYHKLRLINGQIDGGSPNRGINPPLSEQTREIRRSSGDSSIGFELDFCSETFSFGTCP